MVPRAPLPNRGPLPLRESFGDAASDSIQPIGASATSNWLRRLGYEGPEHPHWIGHGSQALGLDQSAGLDLDTLLVGAAGRDGPCNSANRAKLCEGYRSGHVSEGTELLADDAPP